MELQITTISIVAVAILFTLLVIALVYGAISINTKDNKKADKYDNISTNLMFVVLLLCIVLVFTLPFVEMFIIK